MKYVRVFLLLLVIASLQVLGTDAAGASQSGRWASAKPVVYRDVVAKRVAQLPCPTYYRDVFIDGFESPRHSCQFDGSKLSLSIFLNDNSRSSAAVAFPLDDRAYPLDGICENHWRCQYSGDEDLLVVNQTIPFNHQGVVVFRDVSRRIKRVLDPDTLSVRYIFDNQNPDYVFADVNGAKLSARSFALSNNGQWLAVEIEDHGTALVNTQDFTAVRILSTGPRYGFGFDPTIEMAVSNDGKSVVRSGSNAGFVIIDADPSCWESLLKENLWQSPDHAGCRTTDAGVPDMAPSGYTVYSPNFDDSGQQLSLVLAPRSQTARSIILRANGYSGTHKQYLALGDSFSSGEGETDDNQYLPSTNRAPDKCHVSRRSYPFLLAGIWGLLGDQFASVACSGAKIQDVIGSILPSASTWQAIDQALNNFIPGRALQSQFVERYLPDIVTIGIGGNDAGLMTKLRSCAMPDTCEWADVTMRTRITKEIGDIFSKLVNMYARLLALSPGSHLFVVGYPQIISPEGKCDPVTALLLNRQERVFIKNSIHYLNAVVKAAATATGAVYINIEDSFGDRALCGAPSPLAMNGLRLGDDISVISVLPTLKVIGSETFHPTPFGHELIARAINEHYGDLTKFNWCDGVLPVCSDAVVAPEPPEYWKEGGVDDAILRQVDFASLASSDARAVNISMPAGSFEPQSDIRVEVHSTPIVLGVLSADHSGGVGGVADLPSNLPPGVHTLHLIGQGYGSHGLDVYQSLDIPSYVPSDESAGQITIDKPSYESDRNPSPLGNRAVLGVLNVVDRADPPRKVAAVDRMLEDHSVTWPVAVIAAVFALTSLVIGAIVLIKKPWRGT